VSLPGSSAFNLIRQTSYPVTLILSWDMPTDAILTCFVVTWRKERENDTTYCSKNCWLLCVRVLSGMDSGWWRGVGRNSTTDLLRCSWDGDDTSSFDRMFPDSNNHDINYVDRTKSQLLGALLIQLNLHQPWRPDEMAYDRLGQSYHSLRPLHLRQKVSPPECSQKWHP